MLSPDYSDFQGLVRLPKIYHKTNSSSTATKSSASLQDQLTAKSWMFVTPTTQLGFRSSTKRQIASITKTMTCICSVEICQKYSINIKNAYFKITSWSSSINGTSSNLQSNTWMSIEDLMYGLMLPSGNDAALVLAQNLGAVLYFDKTGNKQLIKDVRSIDLTEDEDSIKFYMTEFVTFMNQKAKALKMNKSRFANPHGLDHVHNYSCCEDILLMCKQAMSSELISKIVATPRYKGNFKTFKDKKIICKSTVWVNTNKLLQRNNNVIGIKTGITPKAGGCLATFYKIDEQNYAYIIVLGSSTTEARFKDTQTIIDYITDQNNIF